MDIESYTITPTLKLINLHTPIPGYEKFIGAYLFQSEKKAVVDVGPRVALLNLLAGLAALKVSPGEIDYVILTHIHLDHAGGAGTAIKVMRRARVVAHSRARAHLIDPARLWQASLKTLGHLAIDYGEIEAVPENRLIIAEDGMKLDLGRGLVLEVYLTPGHASHHLSLFDRSSGVLIAGEAAGVSIDGTIRLATAPPFNLAETLASMDKLIALGARKLCYGHFGCYDNGTERLRTARQKLITWHEIVSSAAKTGKTAGEILTLLREKDRGLDYLAGLSKDEYDREYLLLVNSLNGLREAAAKPGGGI